MANDQALSAVTYSPASLIINFNGIPIRGFGDTDICTISWDDTWFTKYGPADGGTARTRKAQIQGTVTLTLNQTSEANHSLWNLLQADWTVDASKSIPAIIYIEDAGSEHRYIGETSWIEGPPETSYTNDIETRTWTIAVGRLLHAAIETPIV